MMRRVNKRDREAALAYKQAQEAAAADAIPPPSALIEAEEIAQEEAVALETADTGSTPPE